MYGRAGFGLLRKRVVTGLTLITLMPLRYRTAVAATDEWASAVPALVNLSRKRLADGLGAAASQARGRRARLPGLVPGAVFRRGWPTPSTGTGLWTTS